MSAEEAPQRLTAPLALEVPEGEVDGRHGEGGGAAPPAEVHAPPHPFPEAIDVPGVLADEHRRQIVVDEGADRTRADVVDGVGVADPLPPPGIAHAGDDEPRMAHLAVGGVGEDDGKRNAVVVRFDRGDAAHAASPSFGPRRLRSSPGHRLRAGRAWSGLVRSDRPGRVSNPGADAGEG